MILNMDSGSAVPHCPADATAVAADLEQIRQAAVLAEPYDDCSDDELRREIELRLRHVGYSSIDRARQDWIRDLRTLDSRGIVD